MQEKDFEIVEKMEKHGGHFVKSFANCCRYASKYNMIKLKMAFHEIWQIYSELVKKDKKNEKQNNKHNEVKK